VLIRSSAEVDQRTSAGSTALHLAAQECDIATVKLLLDYGADCNITTPYPSRIDDASTRSFMENYGTPLDPIDTMCSTSQARAASTVWRWQPSLHPWAPAEFQELVWTLALIRAFCDTPLALLPNELLFLLLEHTPYVKRLPPSS